MATKKKSFKVTALIKAPISIVLTQPWSEKEEVGKVLEQARRSAENELRALLHKHYNIRVGDFSTVQVVGEVVDE